MEMGYLHFLPISEHDVQNCVSNHIEFHSRRYKLFLCNEDKTELICLYTGNTSGVSLEYVLDFGTATDTVPPCAFQKDIEVDFNVK